MRASAQASSDDIDIAALWRTLRRSLPRLLVVCVLAGALTYAVLSLVAPRYDSEAQLAIVAKGTSNPFSDPARAGLAGDSVSVRMDKEAVNTHVRALLSPDLAARIAAETDLAGRIEFNDALGAPDTLSALLRLAGIGAPSAGESDQDRVLRAYFRRLEVFSPKESRFIVVRFSSSDPELAAEVANRIAESYRETLATQSVVETDEVQKALEPKITRLTEEVAAAEAEVERFRGEANIFKGGQQATGLNEQQLAELSAELTRAKAARSEAEARANSAREMMALGGADTLPDVQKSPLIQNLVQQRVRVERQISELSATLLPAHPRMRQLNADLQGLKRQIDAEVAKVVDGLAKEAKVAALREESLVRSMGEVKSRIVNAGPNEAKLRSLEATVKSKRAELERLQAQFEANRVRADSRTVPVEAQIVARARPSSVPSYPKKRPVALLMMASILLLGMAFTVTRRLLSGTLKAAGRRRPGPEDRADWHAPKLPRVAATVPEPPPPQREAPASSRAVTVRSASDAAAHLARLRTPGSSGLRALVAGESDGTDGAEVIVELAQELAALGSAVIVVDWAPDGDGMAQTLALEAAPGMTELLQGAAKFEDVVGCLRDSGVHVISSGAPLPALSSALDPDRINVVLDALDEVYDFIVVGGKREPARRLFEAIQGRFDAGLTVADAKPRAALLRRPPDTFLGYEVDGIALLYLNCVPGLRASPNERLFHPDDERELEALGI